MTRNKPLVNQLSKNFVDSAAHLNLMIVKSLDNNDLVYADRIQNELTALKQLI